MEHTGTIIRIDKKICIVHSEGKNYRALYTRNRIAGAYHKQAKPVTVGDIVVFDQGENDLGWLVKVFPRKTQLAKDAGRGKQQVVVANVEQLCIVTSLHAPPFHPRIIDRLLVAAHKGDMDPVIIVNKIDLREQETDWAKIAELLEIYQKIGYPMLHTSATQGKGLEQLKQILRGKSSVFAGHSGVGKSALLSSIDEQLRLQTQQVGKKSKRGRHTTTRVTLLPLEFGGFVVDTPGVREFSLWNMDPQELSDYFPEMEAYRGKCKYRTCIHIPEPKCAVKEAVESGEISPYRYRGYRRLVNSVQEEEKIRDPRKRFDMEQ